MTSFQRTTDEEFVMTPRLLFLVLLLGLGCQEVITDDDEVWVIKIIKACPQVSSYPMPQSIPEHLGNLVRGLVDTLHRFVEKLPFISL